MLTKHIPVYKGFMVFEVVTGADFACSQRRTWTNVYGGCYGCYDLTHWTTDGHVGDRRLPNREAKSESRNLKAEIRTCGKEIFPPAHPWLKRPSVRPSVRSSVQASGTERPGTKRPRDAVARLRTTRPRTTEARNSQHGKTF